jgi:hypothetical protein
MQLLGYVHSSFVGFYEFGYEASTHKGGFHFSFFERTRQVELASGGEGRRLERSQE